MEGVYIGLTGCIQMCRHVLFVVPHTPLQCHKTQAQSIKRCPTLQVLLPGNPGNKKKKKGRLKRCGTCNRSMRQQTQRLGPPGRHFSCWPKCLYSFSCTLGLPGGAGKRQFAHVQGRTLWQKVTAYYLCQCKPMSLHVGMRPLRWKQNQTILYRQLAESCSCPTLQSLIGEGVVFCKEFVILVYKMEGGRAF